MSGERLRGVEQRLVKFTEFVSPYRQGVGGLAAPLTFDVPDATDPEKQARIEWDNLGAAYLTQETLEAQAATIYMLLDNIERPRRRERWLSLGSGPGLYEIFLLKEWHKPSIVSVDLSFILLKEQKSIVNQTGRQSISIPRRISLVNASMTRLPLGGKGYERIFCINSLHWTPRWRTAIAEVERLLSPRDGSRVYVVIGSAPVWNKGNKEQVAEGLDQDSILDEFEEHNLPVKLAGDLKISRSQFGQPTERGYYVFERGLPVNNDWRSRLKKGDLPIIDYVTDGEQVSRVKYNVETLKEK